MSKTRVKVSNKNLVSTNKGKRDRVTSISRNLSVSHGLIAELSDGLSSETTSLLSKEVVKTTNYSEPISTSVEELVSWANTRTGVNLGTRVATGVPVLCYGAIVNSDDRWNTLKKALGDASRPREHERVLCHGITFGSTYAKARLDSEGKATRFELFTACARCLSALVGSLREDGQADRKKTKWPFEAPKERKEAKPSRNAGVRKAKQKSHNSKKKNISDTKSVTSNNLSMTGFTTPMRAAANAFKRMYFSGSPEDVVEKRIRSLRNSQLYAIATDLGCDPAKSWNKDKLYDAIIRACSESKEGQLFLNHARTQK